MRGPYKVGVRDRVWRHTMRNRRTLTVPAAPRSRSASARSARLPPLATVRLRPLPRPQSLSAQMASLADAIGELSAQVSEAITTARLELAHKTVEAAHLDAICEELHARYVGAMLRLEQREDSIAWLHRAILIHEMKLSEAAAALRRAPDERVAPCVCCFEDVRLVDALRCDAEARHVVCRGCVDAQARVRRDKPCDMPSDTMPCMCSEDCDGAINLYAEMPHLALLHRDHAVQLAMPSILERLDGASESLRHRLHHLRADGTFRGFQCARCGFGPMWNDHCSELVSHQGQETDGGRIDNACPRCGAFVHDVRMLMRWDGRDVASP